MRESIGSSSQHDWLRQEMIAALQPRIQLSPSFFQHFQEVNRPDDDPQPLGDRLFEIAASEVVLADEEHVPAMIEAINLQPNADSFWADREHVSR